MWDTETGTCYFTHQFEQPVRAVALSQGDQHMQIPSDPPGRPAALHVVDVCGEQGGADERDQDFDVRAGGRINRRRGLLNRTILTAQDGIIRLGTWRLGRLCTRRTTKEADPAPLVLLDKTHFISVSGQDREALRLRNLGVPQDVRGGSIVNATVPADPRPHHPGWWPGRDGDHDHSKAGKFDSKIFYKIYEEEIGGIRGHFGPINAPLAPGWPPAHAGWRGRLCPVIHHFDNDYLHQVNA